MRTSHFIVAAIIVAACTAPTDVCGCTPALSFFVRIAGTVSSVAQPDSVRLSATATRGACPAAANATETRLAISGPSLDATGIVRNWIIRTGPDTLCVRVVGRRTIANRVDSIVAPRATVVFRDRDPLDTVSVDLRFP